MVGQEEFQRGFAGIPHTRGIRKNNHALGHSGGTGAQKPGRAFQLHQAQPAGTVSLHPAVAAQRGYVYAQAPRRFQYRFIIKGGRFVTVDIYN
jgi:hypothetical protein